MYLIDSTQSNRACAIVHISNDHAIANFYSASIVHSSDDFMLMGNLFYRMESTPFKDFQTALDKSLGKLGSQPKQIIKF